MTLQATSHTAADDINQAVSNAQTSYVHTLSALLFGASIIFVVGFLPTAAAHNAAHDTRHALAFPCH